MQFLFYFESSKAAAKTLHLLKTHFLIHFPMTAFVKMKLSRNKTLVFLTPLTPEKIKHKIKCYK